MLFIFSVVEIIFFLLHFKFFLGVMEAMKEYHEFMNIMGYI